jgi:hypothetical protein
MGKAEDAARYAEEVRRKNDALETGLRPHPEDRRYPNRGGTSVKLFDGQGDSITNESEYICDWVVKFKPSPSAVANVAAGEGFGLNGQVTLGYDGEQFLEYQPAANPTQGTFVLPLVGKCFQVHGRRVNFRLNRIAPGALESLDIEAAIVPGRVSTWYVSMYASSTLALPGQVPIPTFATRFQILAPFNAGDSFQQMSASGLGVVLSIPSSANNLNYLQPVHPEAAFIQYTTLLGGLQFLVGFEVVS